MGYDTPTRRAIAISAVHVCRRPARLDRRGKVVDPPEVEIIAPRQAFEADATVIDDLVARGHAIALDDDGVPAATLPPLVVGDAP